MGVLQLSLTPTQQTNPRIASIIYSNFQLPLQKEGGGDWGGGGGGGEEVGKGGRRGGRGGGGEKEGFLFAGFVNQPGEILSRRKWSVMKIKDSERKQKKHKDWV